MSFQNSQKKISLPLHEWLAVILILSLIAVLSLGIFFSRHNTHSIEFEEPHYLLEQQFEVRVEGAVEKPGFYRMERGSTVKDLLKNVALSEDADLSKVNLERKLRQGQRIKIPCVKTVKVCLKGAVDSPGIVKLPKGSKLQDLISHEKVKLKPDADLSQLRRKRLLKDGETIYIDRVE